MEKTSEHWGPCRACVLFFLFSAFCWSIVDTRSWVSFCAAKRFGYAYIHSFFQVLSHTVYHRTPSRVPHAMQQGLLIICLTYSSVHMFTLSS